MYICHIALVARLPRPVSTKPALTAAVGTRTVDHTTGGLVVWQKTADNSRHPINKDSSFAQ